MPAALAVLVLVLVSVGCRKHVAGAMLSRLDFSLVPAIGTDARCAHSRVYNKRFRGTFVARWSGHSRVDCCALYYKPIVVRGARVKGGFLVEVQARYAYTEQRTAKDVFHQKGTDVCTRGRLFSTS